MFYLVRQTYSSNQSILMTSQMSVRIHEISSRSSMGRPHFIPATLRITYRQGNLSFMSLLICGSEGALGRPGVGTGPTLGFWTFCRLTQECFWFAPAERSESNLEVTVALWNGPSRHSHSKRGGGLRSSHRSPKKPILSLRLWLRRSIMRKTWENHWFVASVCVAGSANCARFRAIAQCTLTAGGAQGMRRCSAFAH
jgi:hypothetical protein